MNVPQSIYSTVRIEASRNGVDPAVILALIQSESSFNPNAIGDNGKSFGLMQIQIPTAQSVMGDPTITPQTLINPDTNIQIGTAYFALCLSQAGGDIYSALAKYKGAVTNFSGVQQAMSLIPQYETYVAQIEQSMPDIIASQVDSQAPIEASMIPDITNENWYWYAGAGVIAILLLNIFRR